MRASAASLLFIQAGARGSFWERDSLGHNPNMVKNVLEEARSMHSRQLSLSIIRFHNCTMASRPIFLAALAVVVVIFAVLMIKSSKDTAMEKKVEIEHKNKSENEHEDHEELEAGHEVNKTSVSVYQCLHIKNELEPFNLLMALNQSAYQVADFTILNIEEIRDCLNFLEAFQQTVREQFSIFFDTFYLLSEMQIHERDLQLKRLVYHATTRS
jgi:hypothetical protein